MFSFIKNLSAISSVILLITIVITANEAKGDISNMEFTINRIRLSGDK